MEAHLIPWGGLGNRLRSINSFKKLIESGEVKNLSIHWYKTKELNADFYDLIEDFGFPLNVVFSPMDIFFQTILKWRYLEKFSWIYQIIFKLFFDDIIFDQDIKNKRVKPLKYYQGKKVLIISCRELEDFSDFNNLKFQSKFIKYLSKFPENMVGIHIRRGDHKILIKEIILEKYLEIIELETKKGIPIYLATDDIELKAKLIELYPNNLIYEPIPLDRNSEKGIKAALQELIILSNCTKLIGTRKSSFMDFASRYGKQKEFIELS